MKPLLKSIRLWVLAAAAIPLVFYLLTLCPTVFPGDGGELGLAAARLEIAHPPGYPLLTNVGHVWTIILFFLRPILALNFLAALFAATAAALLFLILTGPGTASSNSERVIALLTAVMFALGQTLWSVATNYEVYSLSAALTALIILALLQFHRSGERRWFLVGCYAFGLALCNHLSAGSTGAMLVLVAWFGRDRLKPKHYLTGLLLAVLPLTFYGYLYLRSSPNLVLNWYDPETLWGLKQHLFAHTYQRYIANPRLGDVFPFLGEVWHLFARELVAPFIILAVGGAYLQWRHDHRLAFMLLSVVVVNLALNFNYLIPDIMPYFLPSLLVTIVWIGELLLWTARRGRYWRTVAVVVALAIAVTAAAGNYAKSDLSDRRSAEEYARDLYERVPPKGMLFCGSDNSMFPSLYLHYAENVRPDIRVYGLLPTLTRLRNDLGLMTTSGYNKFPDLLRYAKSKDQSRIVMAREPMQITNDFRNLEPTVYESGLVYYFDSTDVIPPHTMHLNWREIPRLYDQKEAVLYVTYLLIHGEESVQSGKNEGDKLWSQAVDVIHDQENFALCNELAGFLTRAGDLRLSRKTLEQGLAAPGLRFEQRLRLLESLGSVEFESGDMEAAANTFTRVQQMDSGNALARYHLLAVSAEQAVKAEHLQDAINIYRQMLMLFPQQRAVDLQLGKLYLAIGDTSSARSAFAPCLRDSYEVDYIRSLLR